MGPYGRFMGRIKRGTRYVFRRRSRKTGARRFLSTDAHAPGAKRRHRPAPSAAARLVSLALPALSVSLLGVWFLARAQAAPHSLATEVKLLLYVFLTIVFAVRALTASRTPLWVRMAGFLATLPFPVGVLLAAFGIWA